ncbi:signal peptidase I [Pseudomonas sp. GD04087]|uniref:signal peptidase I n=1 Tax=Pseudomonas TaxID=286 RepID=UPI001F473BFA|nr:MULTISPECIES: signal peptidase I [Pseudomonas]MDH0292384.1 signal peptidase I [Pseudomonas sp. GD04087]MDH1050683.1 signal peptidase I [Pseudomonas sp. GD03903]MDH2002501.1 signal peptidase I [Pseudomonas sp. GD03691]
MRFRPALTVVAALLTGLYLVNPLGVPSLDPRMRLLGMTTYSIRSSSMNPTLQPGDYILTSAASYAFGTPTAGDVVVFLNPKDPQHSYVKRIVAGPGDRVRISDGRLYLNDREIAQPYLLGAQNRAADSRRLVEHRVPEEHYFLLGDNRDNSLDSRFFGDVPRANLVGRVSRIWYAQNTGRIGALPEPQP